MYCVLFIAGESVLICKPAERARAETLVKAELKPVESCLRMHGDGEHLSSSMKRAILEVHSIAFNWTSEINLKNVECMFEYIETLFTKGYTFNID